MGSNLLIVVATAALQSTPPDTAPTSIAAGFAFERLADLLTIFSAERVSSRPTLQPETEESCASIS
jgi:hypothetical protein